MPIDPVLLLRLSFIAVSILLLSLLVLSGYKRRRLSKLNAVLLDRFADPISREKEIARLDAEIEARQRDKLQIEKDIEEVRKEYRAKREIFDDLKNEAAIYDETIELAQIGFYEPHFRYEDSERYKEAIRACKERQKDLVRKKVAIEMPTNWEVGGSRAEGKKLETRTIRMTLRAFNNECDAAIGSVTWRNAKSKKKRIISAFEQINRVNETLDASITHRYLEEKLTELDLTIEREEKRKEERDAMAEARRAEREEKKLQEEALRAEKEEAEAAKRLEEARRKAEAAVGEELETLTKQVTNLQAALDEAHARAERAKSMAQQTKLGHVYCISNVGSFGEGVFKIGLTRRLDPADRIRELGDASVPFGFDIHALIFSKDAPALEKSLHAAFADQRVNLANMRKEFFQVTLDAVQEAVERLSPEADFYREVEAQEYHETLMLDRKKKEQAAEATKFPQEI